MKIKNESIHQSILDKGDDYYLSAKKVKDWIKIQKELMSSLRHEMKRSKRCKDEVPCR